MAVLEVKNIQHLLSIAGPKENLQQVMKIKEVWLAISFSKIVNLGTADWLLGSDGKMCNPVNVYEKKYKKNTLNKSVKGIPYCY